MMKCIFEQKAGGSATVNGNAGEVSGFDDADSAQVALMEKLFYTNGVLNADCADITGSWPPAPTSAQLWAEYQGQAQAALSVSDTTMHRIGEAVALGKTSWTTADVVAFVQWRQALRAILSQAQPATIPTALPAKPAYPVGT